MQSFRSRGHIIVAGTLAVLLFVTGAGWWFCQKSDSIAFLPSFAGAKWIIDPAPPAGIAHWSSPIKNAFQQTFVCSPNPSPATLTIRAFGTATVFLNGQTVSNLDGNTKHWKLPTSIAIQGLLKTGTNVITAWVTNKLGPPALWLRLKMPGHSLGSDASWRISSTGKHWHAAHLATKPVKIPRWSPLYDGVSNLGGVKNIWRILALILVASLGLVFAAGRWAKSRWAVGAGEMPIYFLLAIILIGRTALFINDAGKLPDWVGFDAPAHREYVEFIQQHHALPPLNNGWETHQPPLYYLLSAGVAGACGVSADQANALIPLRAVNCFIGLVQCWLALLCLRLLFPNNRSAQAVGLLLAALIPPGLYLSMYLTNDPLTGLLVTTAFYCLLRALRSATNNIWPYAGLGLALGLAMLTKLSAFPALPIFFFALGLRLVLERDYSPNRWLRSVGVAVFVCLITCGWHYLNNWTQTGAIALPHSGDSSWWQNPGFRTVSYYTRFGSVLVSPLFSGLHSFADGIYATLWGDGLISGGSQLLFRPPWNYDLMKAGYLLSLIMPLLFLTGMAIAIRRFMRHPKAEWFAIVAVIIAYLLAILCLTLIGPWLAQVKAFYALPALIPFCALIAAGWNWLAQKGQWLRTILSIVVTAWSLTTFTAYWIRDNNPEAWRCRAIAELQQQHVAQAITSIKRSLQLAPNDFESHCALADAMVYAGNPQKAVQQYAAALQINPDSPDALNVMARLLAHGNTKNAQRAVKLAQHACDLTGYRRDDLTSTLALAYAKAGEPAEAIEAAETACDLAVQNNHPKLIKREQALIASCRKLTQTMK
jgi:4-amino-4-deoxy-L-arabinose transferase-like glycosyltransferase